MAINYHVYLTNHGSDDFYEFQFHRNEDLMNAARALEDAVVEALKIAFSKMEHDVIIDNHHESPVSVMVEGLKETFGGRKLSSDQEPGDLAETLENLPELNELRMVMERYAQGREHDEHYGKVRLEFIDEYYSDELFDIYEDDEDDLFESVMTDSDLMLSDEELDELAFLNDLEFEPIPEPDFEEMRRRSLPQSELPKLPNYKNPAEIPTVSEEDLERYLAGEIDLWDELEETDELMEDDSMLSEMPTEALVAEAKKRAFRTGKNSTLR